MNAFVYWCAGAISIIMNMFGVMDVWLLLKVFFGCDVKLTKRNMIPAGGFLLAIGATMALSEVAVDYQLLIFIGCIELGVLIFTKSRRIRTLIFSIPAMMVYLSFINELGLIEWLFGLEEYSITLNEGAVLTPLCTISDMILFILLVLIMKKSEKLEWKVKLSNREAVVVTIFCWVSIMVGADFQVYEESGIDFVHEFFLLVFVLVANMVGVFVIFHRKRSSYYKWISENQKEAFSKEYSYFQEYKGKQEETIRFRHDFQNHMLIMQKMIQNEEYERAENYFSELSGTAGMSEQKIVTGNEMLDMLLCIKQQELFEKEIQVTMEGKFPNQCLLKPVEGCILFSNLLDNAIEANQKVDGNRFIKIRANVINESLYFEMENPMSGELKRDGDRLITTKENPGEHGIGLENVLEIVKKYHGQYHIEGQKNIFLIQLIFPVSFS